MSKRITTTATVVTVLLGTPVWAGTAAVPGPLAGAAMGPVGLAVAAVGYVGYRIWKSRQN